MNNFDHLDAAEREVQQAGVSKRIELKHADALQMAGLFPARSFDVILCRNILEYVEDPDTVLQAVALILREGSSLVSILVRNQAGEVLESAIRNGDLTAAEHNLKAEWGHESLYGGRVQRFTPERLKVMLTEAFLAIAAERGLRFCRITCRRTVANR